MKIQRAKRGIIVFRGLLTTVSNLYGQRHIPIFLLDITKSYVTAGHDGPSSWHSDEDFVGRPTSTV
jgi:hypothetical protein